MVACTVLNLDTVANLTSDRHRRLRQMREGCPVTTVRFRLVECLVRGSHQGVQICWLPTDRDAYARADLDFMSVDGERYVEHRDRSACQQGSLLGVADGRLDDDELVSAYLRSVFALLQPSDSLMASASPDGGISSDGKNAPPPTLAEKQAALYDISARTVYMPDGTRLEAHSGLGNLMDDPRRVHVRNRGATPPQVYELTMRERPFHGVEALRMKPVAQGDLFGRSGLLTHSYLMGPNGNSNGCVFFKDYATFVQAFKAGAVKVLIVVPSLAESAVVTAQKL
jgi:hypothetical protein